jgi:hypothetical protein
MANRVGPINPEGRRYTRPRTTPAAPLHSAQQSFNIGEAAHTAIRYGGAAVVGVGALLATRSVASATGAAAGWLTGQEILNPPPVIAPNKRKPGAPRGGTR